MVQVVSEETDPIVEFVNGFKREEHVLEENAERDTMLHPRSKFQFVWNATSAVLIQFYIIIVPLRLAFRNTVQNSEFLNPVAGMWLVIDIWADLFFILDIFINFRTWIFVNGKLQRDKQVITNTYLRGWFLADALSSLPVSIVANVLDVKINEVHLLLHR